MTTLANEYRSAVSTHVFWRRLIAYAVDFLLLSVVGWGIGTATRTWMEKWWPWTTLLGFALCLFYFGFLNSRLSRGRTLGKFLLGLRTVGSANRPLSIKRSILRACFIAFPYTLNSLLMPHFWSAERGLLVISFVCLSLIAGDIYYFLFNRLNRQSFHDVAVGSYVVKASHYDVTTLPRAHQRHHFVFLFILVLIAVATFWGVPLLARKPPYNEYYDLQSVLTKSLPISYALISNKTLYLDTGEGKTVPRRYFLVTALWNDRSLDEEEEARRMMKVVFAHSALPKEYDAITVNLLRGYDIGIFSDYDSATFTGTVDQWREKALEAPQPAPLNPPSE